MPVPIRPSRCTEKIAAAPSDANDSAPTLNSSWWKTAAACAPFDCGHGDREHECCTRADNGCRRKRTDCTDGDRAGLLHLERQHLAEGRRARRSSRGRSHRSSEAVDRACDARRDGPGSRRGPTRSARRRGTSKNRGTGGVVRASGLTALDLGDDRRGLAASGDDAGRCPPAARRDEASGYPAARAASSSDASSTRLRPWSFAR